MAAASMLLICRQFHYFNAPHDHQNLWAEQSD